jgi:hypothetical protein
MGNDLKIYDADQVTVILASIPIDSGYADGEFLSIEQDTDDFTDVVGTDGEVTRSKTNDRRATITLTLMQSSGGNAVLSALNNLDVNTPGGAGVGTLLVRDKQGTSLYAASKCWIAKPPTATFGREAGSREWKIRCADLKRLDGGN